MEHLLEEVLLTRTAEQWESSLLAVGVGCVTADGASHFAFLYEDPQAQAIGMMTASEHPNFGGKYWRHAPVIRFSRTPGEARPFCAKGDSTRKILAELGYDEADMLARMKDGNVVAWTD